MYTAIEVLKMNATTKLASDKITSHTIRCHIRIYIRLRVQEVTRVQSWFIRSHIR